jgi:diaminohydroxyphosphoribosylaminopyrimidine deaminase / 5-amino-6-(5-phosphoribosylamino)uracil reductase
MGSLSASDERQLLSALELARGQAPFASPNPAVGCVLVRDGTVIAEGAHRYADRDHAEIVALKKAEAAGLDVRGATAFVTLEPCSHHGRTAPCSNALIAAGVARCVVATIDPNPQVSGEGLARMRTAGMEVDLADGDSVVAQAARRLNDAFAFSIRNNRPFVTLKAALSVDGMLAPPQDSRTPAEPFWLTGAAARADVQRLRHANDAVLTGIGTVLADDPLLTDRTGEPRRRPLLRVVLDGELRMPLDSALVRSAAEDLLIVAREDAPLDREVRLKELGAEVLRLSSDAERRIDLSALLEYLQGRGVRSVLAEGGSALNGALLQADLVDRAVLYFAEVELGADALPFAAGQGSPYALVERMSDVKRETFAYAADSALEDVRISGYLHDPWANISSASSEWLGL